MKVQEWLGENNELGINIWNGKYRYENEDFDEWLDRVSNGDKEIKRLIKEKKFLFGGRILANRGLHKKGVKVTYSNCYVISPPEDSIESIFDCAKRLARTYSFGGGCGIDIGKLAPRGAKVNNTARETSGSVSFMDLYSMVTGLIGQNGRRGALMISIPCNHPDLEEFIDIKSDLDRVTKANISIRITDDFMNAVKNDEKYTLSFTREESGEVITKVVRAKDLFMKIALRNWEMAEPGMLFWDRIEGYNLLNNNSKFKYAGTNPCAEEPLPAGGSCLLGSINLSEYVINPFTRNAAFDGAALVEDMIHIVKAMNDVLDEGLPLHPLEEQRNSVRDWRQIGIGIMGLADMLIKLGYKYGSEDSIYLCNSIGDSIACNAIKASAILASKTKAYPEYNTLVLESEFLKSHTRFKDLVEIYGLANSQLLTIAPTGSLSTMLGISGGIEPIFANSYTRKTESLHGKDVYYKVYTPIVQKYMDINGIKDEAELPDIFVTAGNLNYKDRIKMQAVWQNHIDASISSTVNVPNEFTVEEVADLYIKAWEAGLKGITIFRDGCKRTGILTTGNNSDQREEKKASTQLQRGDIVDADDNLVGKKRKLITGCGSLHCTAFFDPDSGEARETYFSKGSTGGCNNFMIALSRLISLAVRGGIDINTVFDQLQSCGTCPSYATRKAVKGDTSKGSCCPSAIGYALKEMYEEMVEQVSCDEEDVVAEKEIAPESGVKCPECGANLIFTGGCNSCPECGYSKCS